MSKIPNFEMFNFEKQRPVSDAECPQESNGAICFCFVRGIEPPPQSLHRRPVYYHWTTPATTVLPK